MANGVVRKHNKPCIVYGLFDSAIGEIRYIGQTTLSLPLRLKHHLTCSNAKPKRHLSCWIRKTVSNGSSISIVSIKENAVWNITEKEVIADFRNRGFSLVNLTDGGDGAPGKIWTEQQRQSVSNKMKGVSKSPGHKSKISEFMKTRPIKPDSCRKISEAHKGKRPKNLSDLHEAQKGVPRSEETKRKISESLKRRKTSNLSEEKG